MYNLLVRVFFANSRKWIFLYLPLGWGECMCGGRACVCVCVCLYVCHTMLTYTSKYTCVTSICTLH